MGLLQRVGVLLLVLVLSLGVRSDIRAAGPSGPAGSDVVAAMPHRETFTAADVMGGGALEASLHATDQATAESVPIPFDRQRRYMRNRR